MNNKKNLILVVMLLVVGFIGAENFVMLKKKRHTNAQVKQDDAQQLGEIIEECAQVIAVVNDLQQESIKHVHKLLKESNGFFSAVDKTKLQVHGQVLAKVIDDLRIMHKRMTNNFTDLKNALH
jgi:hypothetical protein